jgi:uncharacterized membrane protein YcgQ (UPF0703/DUF1980 family)
LIKINGISLKAVSQLSVFLNVSYMGFEMDANFFAIVIISTLFLFIFLSGYFLSRSGKPFNVPVLTIHKLLSLAALIYLSTRVVRVPLNSLKIGLVTAAGLFFVSAIISGGLLSTDKPMPAIVHRIHQIIPYLTVLSTFAVFLVVAGG